MATALVDMRDTWMDDITSHAEGHDRMETEEIVFTPAERNLASFLKEHVQISDIQHGYFSVLTDDLVRIVFSFLEDDQAYSRACRVNKKWLAMVQQSWRKYCVKRGILEEETFWAALGKDWKWILQSKMRTFKPDAVKEGVGSFSEAEGVIYEGEWSENRKHGAGKEKSAEIVYQGEWVNDMKEGQGIMVVTRGARYEGQWKANKKNGRGVYLFPNGDRYDGEWRDDMKHGHGVYTFGTGKWEGDKYDGHWRDNKKWGRGVYTWKDGDIYDGEFEDDNFNGYGSYYFPCGDRYVGQWKADKRYGFGVYMYHHGGKYEGTFKDGKRHGKGVFSWKDGDKFEGTWNYGSRFGIGTFFAANGTKLQQHWNEPPDANYSILPPEKHPRLPSQPRVI